MLKLIALRISFGIQDVKASILVPTAGWFLLVGFFVVAVVDRSLAYRFLMASHRANYNRLAAALIRRNLPGILTNCFQEKTLPGEKELTDILGRSLVLKKPVKGTDGQLEKGVLLIKFTETFAYFLNHVDCQQLTEHYHVVLEPSWVGQALEEVLGWARYDAPVYVLTAERLDYEFIASLNCNLKAIRVGSGEFVDYRVFKPLGMPKIFDCVSIGNYSDYKRLHAYVFAIRDAVKVDPSFRAALVCARWGGQRKNQVKELIRLLGLQNNIEIFESLNQSEVNAIIDQSYINLLLSRREGASKVLFESLFVNVPSIVLAENLGVNKELFNPLTGLVVPEKALANWLLQARSIYSSFSPRQWAMENIAPERSIEKIHDAICTVERNGQPFASGLYVKVNVPEARYMFDYPTINLAQSKALVGQYIRYNEDLVQESLYWTDTEATESLEKLQPELIK